MKGILLKYIYYTLLLLTISFKNYAFTSQNPDYKVQQNYYSYVQNESTEQYIQIYHHSKSSEAFVNAWLASDYGVNQKQKMFKVHDVQSKIDNKIAILKFKKIADHLHIFLITQNNTAIYTYKNANVNLSIINEFTKNISIAPVYQVQQTQNKIYKSANKIFNYLFCKKLQQTLQQSSKLVIIPDQELAELPFDALLVKPYLNLNKEHPAYLILTHQISYINTINELTKISETEKKSDELRCLAFAPKYTSSTQINSLKTRSNSLQSLPGAVQEINYLQQLLAGEFYAGEVSKKIFKKAIHESFDIIHLAMHGKANKENPDYSSLVFPLEEGETNLDHELYSHEIVNIPINANMVVLSACETGVSKKINNEAQSIAQAFKNAGSKSVIHTRWNIEDLSSATIMKVFYDNLLAGTDKSEALQQAKIQFMCQNQASPIMKHPYFWASYTLTGNISPIISKQPNAKTKKHFIALFLTLIILTLSLGVFYIFKYSNIANNITKMSVYTALPLTLSQNKK